MTFFFSLFAYTTQWSSPFPSGGLPAPAAASSSSGRQLLAAAPRRPTRRPWKALAGRARELRLPPQAFVHSGEPINQAAHAARPSDMTSRQEDGECERQRRSAGDRRRSSYNLEKNKTKQQTHNKTTWQDVARGKWDADLASVLAGKVRKHWGLLHFYYEGFTLT